MGLDWQTRIPQFDCRIAWDFEAQRDRVALGAGRGCGEPGDLADELLLDALGLFDINVNDFTVIFQIEARVMAMEVGALHDIAAAHDVRRLIDIDVALDVWRHIICDASRIVGYKQAHRDIFGIERAGKRQRRITAHGMANERDWGRIASIILDRLIRSAAPGQIGLYACRDRGLADALGKAVHAARIDQAGDAAEQIGAPARFKWLLWRRMRWLP